MGVLGSKRHAQYKPRNSWRNGVLALYGHINRAELRTFSCRVPEVVVPSFVGAPVENFALGILASAKQALSSAFRVRLHWWMGAHLMHGLIRMMHLDGLQQREIPRCAMNHLIASVH